MGAARLLRTLTKVGELGPGRSASATRPTTSRSTRSRTKATRRARRRVRGRRHAQEIYADHPTQFDPGALLAVLAEDPAS